MLAVGQRDVERDARAGALDVARLGARVAMNDVGQRQAADLVELVALERALVPESVAIAEPLELIGDGVTPRYHDSERGEITLHSRETLAAVARATGDAQLSELRFRSNIAIDGIAAWGEDQWIGRRLRIGAVEFEVTRTKVRCLATHANPASGVCDVQVMQTLTRAFKQQQPTFAVALATNGEGGEIRVGDTLEFLG